MNDFHNFSALSEYEKMDIAAKLTNTVISHAPKIDDKAAPEIGLRLSINRICSVYAEILKILESGVDPGFIPDDEQIRAQLQSDL